jgi:drug/metabolite transporter (DMT)-like permease
VPIGLGETAALLSAALWAFGSIIYSRIGKTLPPLWLNLFKGTTAIAFLIITTTLTHTIPNLPTIATPMLLLSGAIGIGIGDTAYFGAINRIGPRRCLMLKALAPAIGSLLSWLWLKETLSPVALLGMALTSLGITWVVSERTAATETPKANTIGILLGLTAAITEGIGAVLSHAALTQLAVDPLWSAILRLTGGVTLLLPAILYQTLQHNIPRNINWGRIVIHIAIAAFFTTYIGIWLQQIALQRVPTGIAQTLGATSPLFILPMVALMGERVSRRAIAGALLAFTGVATLVFPSALQ